ncbi:MAG: signal recognition particle-docking protein FtsY [Alphaproteobacteria bacterium]|nr:MAG: signal recognition particle-docking protein FtsY [Alphaproteobacteria bacterium]
MRVSDEDTKKKRRWFGFGKTDVEAEAEPVNAATEQPHDEAVEDTAKPSLFKRLTKGLSRSSGAISDSVTSIFTKAKLDSETLQELEDVLITADLGVETTMAITGKLAKDRFDKEISPQEIKTFVAEEVAQILRPLVSPFNIDPSLKPHVVLMVGVNGAGKTTTIGKMARRAKDEGLKVMLAAGDTFRAAAIDQLKVWGERVGAPVIARDVGADAAGLAFDALEQARRDNVDVLFIDTAGRLQNKTELMAELEKITRVIKKVDPSAPHSVLLVLDATTGQNALNQAKVFTEIAGVTGLIMTKLDGTARGGILVAVAAKQGLPIHAIGVGESIEDFQPFDAEDFARALVGLDSAAAEAAQ